MQVRTRTQDIERTSKYKKLENMFYLMTRYITSAAKARVSVTKLEPVHTLVRDINQHNRKVQYLTDVRLRYYVDNYKSLR